MPRSLPLLRRCRLALGEARPVRCGQRLFQAAFRIAAVIFDHDRRLIGIRLLGNHVAAADLGLVDAEIARGDVDQPLQHEGRLRPPGAAIGIDRHGVGEDHLHFAIDRGRQINAGEQRSVEIGRDVGTEGRNVAADIGERVDPQPEELAVLVERKLGFSHVVAALRVGDKAFAPLADPFDRPADFRAGPGDDRFFGIVELLHAEAAADVGRHDPQLVLRNVEDESAHQQPHHVRELARSPERVLAGRRVVFGDRRARLHRIADQPVVDEADARHMRGLAESGIGRRLVAERPVAAQIVRHVVEQKRRVALDGVEHADDRRQHLIIDDQRVGGALRLLARLRHDEGDRIADMAHLALRQRRMRRLLHRQAVLAGDAPAAGQSADAGGLEIFAGEHGEHARHGKRRGRVDRLDSRRAHAASVRTRPSPCPAA